VRLRLVRRDGSPVAFIISANVRRRQLTESQRAMVAAKIADMKKGRPGLTASRDAVNQTEATEQLDVGRRRHEARSAKQHCFM
jgi:hypothetical protein